MSSFVFISTMSILFNEIKDLRIELSGKDKFNY